MASASALAALQAGIEPDASTARARTKGRPEDQDANLSMADVRRLLLMHAAETGDVSALQGRKLEQLGVAEAALARMAKANGITPLEMRNALREAATIPQELVDAVAAGRADAADALANPGRAQEIADLDAADDAAAAEQQAQQLIPESVMAKFTEALDRFGSAADREPALQVLQQAVALSGPASYAVATALLFAE